jgi:hypothetical protein
MAAAFSTPVSPSPEYFVNAFLFPNSQICVSVPVTFVRRSAQANTTNDNGIRIAAKNSNAARIPSTEYLMGIWLCIESRSQLDRYPLAACSLRGHRENQDSRADSHAYSNAVSSTERSLRCCFAKRTPNSTRLHLPSDMPDKRDKRAHFGLCILA